MIGRIVHWTVSSWRPLKKTLWRNTYQTLAWCFPQADWTFMNYGYAEMDPTAARQRLEEADEQDRYFIQLYQLVAGAVDLQGRKVLEVGSGRGGGSSYIARYLKPASVTGVDISSRGIAFSRRRHRVPHLSFKQGDAEALPFEADSFDVVVNVESSHCYPSMATFLAEVKRVLKPGGFLLWADLRAEGELEETRRAFKRSGLTGLRERVITEHVLFAMERDSDRKLAFIRRVAPWFLRDWFQQLAGTAGTRVYRSFRSGELQYLHTVFQKPE